MLMRFVNHTNTSVPRPAYLPTHLPLINIPITPPRLTELHIAPPDIAPAHVAHPPRPADTAPARPRLLIILDDARLRPPTKHRQHTNLTLIEENQTAVGADKGRTYLCWWVSTYRPSSLYEAERRHSRGRRMTPAGGCEV